MINNVFDFGDAVARDVMVPRIDMVMVDVNATYKELIELFRKERFTRIPVYENSTDNVIGIINVKDFLLYDNAQKFSLRDLLRQPLYTYEYKKTAELMVEMRKTSNNIIIVLDEYGATPRHQYPWLLLLLHEAMPLLWHQVQSFRNLSRPQYQCQLPVLLRRHGNLRS